MTFCHGRTGKERGYEGAPGKLSQSFVEINGKFFLNKSSGQVNGEMCSAQVYYLQGKDGKIVSSGYERKKGNHTHILKRSFNEKDGTLERELVEEDGKLKEEATYSRTPDGRIINAKKITYNDQGGIVFERDISALASKEDFSIDDPSAPRDTLPNPANIQLRF